MIFVSCIGALHSTLYSTLLCCTSLHSTPTLIYCISLYSILLCCTSLHSTLLYSTLLYTALLHVISLSLYSYSTLLHITSLYSTLLHRTESLQSTFLYQHIAPKGRVFFFFCEFSFLTVWLTIWVSYYTPNDQCHSGYRVRHVDRAIQ